MFDLPTWTLVIGTAAIDSINPCAIGVLILMISIILGQHGSVKRMVYYGGMYIFAIFLTYLAAGLGLVYFLSTVPITVAEYISIAVGTLVILAGILEIKDFFWYGRWFSLAIPVGASKKIHEWALSTKSVWGVMALGAFVAAVELPCTGAPYLAIITILKTNFNFMAFIQMVVYNIVFVAPLIVILILVASGRSIADVKKWKEDNRHLMRLAIGLLLVGLGWLLILIANGTINFG